MKKHINSKKSGFTIIEVLIVLAIIGLIMVVVFLAVPAIQRAGRNNAYNTNANNVLSGVNTFSNNNNGKIPTVYNLADNLLTIGDTNDNKETVKVDGNTTSVTYSILGADNLNPTVATGVIQVYSKAKCNPAGKGVVVGATRSIAVMYGAEGGSGEIVKCVGS